MKGKTVELVTVPCPFYDGPNLDFDSEAYRAEYQEWRNKAGEWAIETHPAMNTIEAIDKYNEVNPAPKCNNWIYADYEQVKTWLNTLTETDLTGDKLLVMSSEEYDTCVID